MGKLLVLITASLIFLGSTFEKDEKTYLKVNTDTLFMNIEEYADMNVEIEGKIIHVCGVNNKKMMMETGDGKTIRILPGDTTMVFTYELNNKILKIKGLAGEERRAREVIEETGKKKNVFCHIDFKPCISSGWVDSQVESGRYDTIMQKDLNLLRKRMSENKRDYISIVTIFADSYEIIELNE